MVGAGYLSIVIFFLTFNLSPIQSFSTKFALSVNSQPPQNLVTAKSVKPVQNVTVKKTVKPPITLGLPARLKIPKIKVDVALERVGLTADGAVGAPKGPINAAWYKLGPRPGEIGSAVITGHYGVWKSGIPTVFNNLDKLSPGDKLSVKDDRGIITTFVVREIKSYDPKAGAAEVFASGDGKAHLNLITCEGIWDKTAKSYPKRLVVFTDKE